VSHLSTLKLNRYRYGELDESEMASLRTHLEGCEHCGARLQAQENNRAAFELTPMPDAIRALGRKAEKKSAWWSNWQVWLAPALGAAALVLLVLPAGPGNNPAGLKDPDRQPPEQIQTKGAKDVLEAWLETERGPRHLAIGAEVGPGARIQLRYRMAPGSWVTFAGSDASGQFEVYGTFPATEGDQTWQSAPFSLTLDDVPGIQKFYAVFTNDPPTPESVEDSLRQEGKVLGAETQIIHLTKVR
jgi:hypothetical protein